MLDGLCITVLTGNRLELLKRTLESLNRADSAVLESAYVVVFLNGKDEETAAYLSHKTFIDEFLYEPSPLPEPIGKAMRRLVRRVQKTDARFLLHLEDDWECTAKDASFLLDAGTILQMQEKVGQVRLRSASEKTSLQHMVGGSFHAWQDTEIGGVKCKVSGLHFTFNPSLVRVRDLSSIFSNTAPDLGVRQRGHERDVAANFKRFGWSVAQLMPGVFRHIGIGKLSRVSKNRKAALE